MFLSFLFSPWVPLGLAVLYYVLPYIRNKSLRDIPAPFPAAFSNLWLFWYCRHGLRSVTVHEAHKKYGTLVRIQPNHVSVADPDAVPIIYGHGNGFLKSDYYDVFVAIQRDVFNTRDRAEHTRKRKQISHTFSQKSIGQFEQYMHHNLDVLVKQWDSISSSGRGQYAKMDAVPWFNYLAFDIIGDLAFGAPFGMLEVGKDTVEVRASPDSPPTYAPAIDVLSRRGEVSGTIGCIPQLRPYAKYFPDPFFYKGTDSVRKLAGIGHARVKQRLDNEEKIQRVDLLARIMEGRDENGNKLGREELASEALTQLIAGSGTTSNTLAALLYHILHEPEVVKKLQAELDAALPNDEVPQFEQVKDLPYVDAVIKEALRIHGTSALGLPRTVPPGPPVEIAGHQFLPGTVVSVPTYTVHHLRDVWGDDVDEYRPDRWAEDKITEQQKAAFVPFSYGPRACVGRNVAEMELALIVSTVFKRYEFELYQRDWEVREGFLRRPLHVRVGIRRRGEKHG